MQTAGPCVRNNGEILFEDGLRTERRSKPRLANAELTSAGKNWAPSAIRFTTAIGVSQISEANYAISAKPRYGGVSKIL